jgi:hypothetical protein
VAQVSIDRVLHLQDFGLERLDEDKAIVGFAQKAEARLVRRLDFAKGWRSASWRRWWLLQRGSKALISAAPAPFLVLSNE